ncbi:MAG TPA: hypothetical protein VL442_06765 [Mucilaginibacter sp.]|jgi:hypothetical protein|nr:hypothetical protein [Mucilaginibacter sp.]
MMDKRTVEEKKAKFLEELTKCMAIKTQAARRCKIGRTMLYEYLKNDLDFALKVQEIEEAAVDYAEGKLSEMVAMGDRAAIMFFLKAKAKDRGYH